MLCRGGLDQDRSRCVKCVMLFMGSLGIEGVANVIPGLGSVQFYAGVDQEGMTKIIPGLSSVQCYAWVAWR